MPETERLEKRVIFLIAGTAVGPDQIRKICQIIRMAVVNAPEAKESLLGHVAKRFPKL